MSKRLEAVVQEGTVNLYELRETWSGVNHDSPAPEGEGLVPYYTRDLGVYLFMRDAEAERIRLQRQKDRRLKKMKEGIKNDGRTMIVAGHNPTRSWKLAESPGMTGVILAHMADVPLVPVALDIDSKTAIGQSTDIPTRIKNFIMFKRPNSKVIFGEPMNLAKIPEDKLQLAINLYSPDARRVMTPEQIAIATETLKILQEEASQIMEALASKLSPEKRGKWGKNLKEKQK